MVKYVHTNIIAKDWKALSSFYQNVFGCVPVPPRRDLKGEWLDRLTGIEGAHITGEHLCLPGYGDKLPTIEIFSYENIKDADKSINSAGFSHIAFEVSDVNEFAEKIIDFGGSLAGEIVSAEYEGVGTAHFVYARDIEGNIIELQSWKYINSTLY